MQSCVVSREGICTRVCQGDLEQSRGTECRDSGGGVGWAPGSECLHGTAGCVGEVNPGNAGNARACVHVGGSKGSFWALAVKGKSLGGGANSLLRDEYVQGGTVGNEQGRCLEAWLSFEEHILPWLCRLGGSVSGTRGVWQRGTVGWELQSHYHSLPQALCSFSG